MKLDPVLHTAPQLGRLVSVYQAGWPLEKGDEVDVPVIQHRLRSWS